MDYDEIFSKFAKYGYSDLKARFDLDYQNNVAFNCYDFSKDEWLISTLASALDKYLKPLEFKNDKKN